MNTYRSFPQAPTQTRPRSPSAGPSVPMPTRNVHRERDFGVGYGNSSGYASPPRYADNRSHSLFRCA